MIDTLRRFDGYSWESPLSPLETMALDEDALEAMLQRQRRADETDDGPQKVQLTDKTDEFEVYERPKPRDEPHEEGAGPEAPQAAPPQARPAAPMHHAPQDAAQQDAAPRPDGSFRGALGSAARHAGQQEAARMEPAEEAAPPPGPPAEETPRAPGIFQPLQPRAASETTAPPARAEEAHEAVGGPPRGDPAPAAAEETTHAPRSHAPAPAASDQASAPAASAALGAGSGDGCRIALVQSTFNNEITDMMADLARKRIEKLGAGLAAETTVPGVFDLPLAAQRLARRDDIDAVVVLGCVVQGETRHDEVITHAAAQQIARIACETDTPIGFGVIGPGMTWKQAEARIVSGRHAVDAAVAQWRTLRA